MPQPSDDEKKRARRGFEDCRCLEVGVDKFGECLKPGPATCAYALPFGYCFLCTHPRVKEIIENTMRNQPVSIPFN